MAEDLLIYEGQWPNGKPFELPAVRFHQLMAAISVTDPAVVLQQNGFSQQAALKTLRDALVTEPDLKGLRKTLRS